MIDVRCFKERAHKTTTGEYSNCNALLFAVEELKDGELVSICRVCGQKWKIIIEEGEYYLVQLPKNARFEFEDKLKVEE